MGQDTRCARVTIPPMYGTKRERLLSSDTLATGRNLDHAVPFTGCIVQFFAFYFMDPQAWNRTPDGLT